MSDKTSTKKKKKKYKKPNPFIYYAAYLIGAPYFKFRLHTTYDTAAIKDIKGPALVVCPHISNIDFLLVAFALIPHRATFVVSHHFMTKHKIRPLLEKMNVISKKMFCPDIQTIMNILRAKDAGQIIVLFPEGRLTCSGHSLHVTDGSAELVKKLGVNVYTITGDGAYKTLPKWGKASFRPGRIHVSTSKLLDESKIKNLSVEEINEILEKAILHDEDKVFEDITYKCKKPALGLDGILYKCPECKSEYRMVSDDYHIRCKSCGFEAELDNKYQLHGGPFKHINDWYFWQDTFIDTNVTLESDTILATPNSDGYMNWNAGSGHITMNKDEIHFEGTCFGEPLEFTESTSVVKGYPASVGNHFDLYSKKVLYNMILQPEPRANIKWVSYLDKVTEEKAERS